MLSVWHKKCVDDDGHLVLIGRGEAVIEHFLMENRRDTS